MLCIRSVLQEPLRAGEVFPPSVPRVPRACSTPRLCSGGASWGGTRASPWALYTQDPPYPNPDAFDGPAPSRSHAAARWAPPGTQIRGAGARALAGTGSGCVRALWKRRRARQVCERLREGGGVQLCARPVCACARGGDGARDWAGFEGTPRRGGGGSVRMESSGRCAGQCARRVNRQRTDC